MPKVVGLIPARGGSKGLPGKNTAVLNGKPLLVHTIEAAKDSGVCDELIVSSDSPQILSIAKANEVQIHSRPPSLALDDTPTDPVIADLIAAWQLSADDLIILLQPTSPLRNAKHICDALSSYREHNGKALVSVCKIPNKYLKAYLRNGEYLQPVFEAGTGYKRRQDLPDLYLPNGAIYIFSVADFQLHDLIPRDQIVPFIMTSETSHDIDTEADLVLCERLLTGMQERRKF